MKLMWKRIAAQRLNLLQFLLTLLKLVARLKLQREIPFWGGDPRQSIAARAGEEQTFNLSGLTLATGVRLRMGVERCKPLDSCFPSDSTSSFTAI